MTYAETLQAAHKARVERMFGAGLKPVPKQPETKPEPQKPVDDPNLIIIAFLQGEVAYWKGAYKALSTSDRQKAKEVLSDGPTVAKIKDLIASSYGLRPDALESHRRRREIVRPRQIAMHLCVKLTRNSLPAIGRYFGGFDHTTVLHADRRIEELRQGDPQFDAKVADLELRLIS